MADQIPQTEDDLEESREITKEETNYLRIANLLLKFAPPVVRKKFDKEFNPGGLQNCLNMEHKTLTSLSKKRVINENQWDLLFPKTGKAVSSTFDLTLMIVLIRHLSKIKIQDKLPQSTDTSLGADISRLKYYRNKSAHNDDGTLTDNDFEQWWDDLSQAIIRLGGASYVQKCVLLKERKLDNSDLEDIKEIMKELRNIDKSNDPIPKGRKDVHVKTIDEWETKDESVIETKAMVNLVDQITKKDIVTVIGPPGCGKTTAVHHVALNLHKEQGYDIVPAINASNIGDYYNPDRKQLFVFDDACGKYSVELQSMLDWKKQSDTIKKIIKDKHVKILLTCRSYIFDQFRNVNILCTTVCDFLSLDNVLTVNERFEIAKSHLTEDEAKKIKQIRDFVKYDFFPLLCSFYARHRSGDIEQFFASPNKVIREDLESFMKDEDQTTFAILSLFVIYNNIITDEILSKKSDLRETLDEIYEHFRMSKQLSCQVVKDQLNYLTKSYAKKINNQYSIIHDKLFDILVCFCGEHMFDFIVEFCHADILRDRFQFETVEDHQEYLITIPVGKEIIYIEQVFKYFTKNNFSTVFANRQIRYEVYRQKLIQFIKENEEAKTICLSLANENVSPLFTVVNQGYSDLLKMLIDMKYDVNIVDKEGRTPTYIAAEGGYTDCVQLLLSNGADPNITHHGSIYKGRSPLYVASTYCHVEVVRLLLNAKCNPNQCTYQNETPLYAASEKGHLEIVRLLLRHNVDPNISRTDMFYEDETPLYVAAENGFSNIVELLLDNKADPNRCKDIEYQNKSPLLKASKKGHTEVVKLLLNNHVDPNICRKDNGECPLHAAANKGHTEIVKLLLSFKADPNVFRIDKNHKGETPLHMASQKDHTEIVKLLLLYNANPNMCLTDKDDDGETPLYIASVKGNTTIVKELLRHKASLVAGSKSQLYAAVTAGHTQIVTLLLDNKCIDFNDCDKFQPSPIFIASWKGYTQIVELLLRHNCNPHRRNTNGLSPLYISSKLGHTEIATLLLQYKCHPAVCDQYNQSPLFVASRNGHYVIVEKLLEYNSDPLLCNVNGLSPLTVSLLNTNRGVNKRIVMLLLEHCLKERKITEKECSFLIAVLNQDDKVVEQDIEGNSFSSLVLGGKVSPLFMACCCNSRMIIKLLLEDMAKENTLSSKLTNPALLAGCMYGFVNIVRLLLEYGSDPNGDTETGIPPLCLAAEYGHTNVAAVLIEYNCNLDICNKDDVSPLYIASVMNHEDTVQLLLRQKCNINWTCNKTKRTPLYMASLLNHTNIVEMLLEYNCDTNICDKHNQSPLFVATQMNHTETVKLLLEGKCDCNMCDKYQRSPLHIATEHLNMVIVRLLIEHNCNPNICDKYNRTALSLILEKIMEPFFEKGIDSYQIIKFLIEHNTDTNLCNSKKESPLHLCSKELIPGMFLIKVMTLLLQHKCDPNLRNINGETPLFLAAKQDSFFRKVQVLLEGNADPDIPDIKNRTPLYVASKHGEMENVKLLLDYHSNIDTCDNKRRTPLYVASIQGHTDIVETLLEHKCNPDICDDNNCSPLFMSALHGHFDIVKLLLQFKCNPYICNKDGDFPGFVAMEKGHADIANYLLSLSGQ